MYGRLFGSNSGLLHIAQFVLLERCFLDIEQFAEYAVAKCSQMSLKPSPLEFMPARAMPTVGLAALQMLSKTGILGHSPKSMVIASGQVAQVTCATRVVGFRCQSSRHSCHRA